MARIMIPVHAIEFEEGGNTIWVQGVAGTVLRIKVEGKLSTRSCGPGYSPSHLDLMASDRDPVFCLGHDLDPEDANREACSREVYENG